MYLEHATSAIESELDVPAVHETVAPGREDLNNGIRLLKGVIIASLFSLPIWIVVLSLIL
jgi:hypothetical protein